MDQLVIVWPTKIGNQEIFIFGKIQSSPVLLESLFQAHSLSVEHTSKEKS